MPQIHSGNAAAATSAMLTFWHLPLQAAVGRLRRPARPSQVMRKQQFSKITATDTLLTAWAKCPAMLPAQRLYRARCHPQSATRLMMRGIFQPCQMARLYSRQSRRPAPPTARQRHRQKVAYRPALRARYPQLRQASTSSSTGTRIQWEETPRTGSCGRSVALGPKNTSTV